MIIAEDGTELYLLEYISVDTVLYPSKMKFHSARRRPGLRPGMRNGGINRHNKVGE